MKVNVCSVWFLSGVVAFGLLAASSTRADRQPHAGLLRYPDVSTTQIVFQYSNDLWLVPRTGGLATPLASPPASELFPRFSPDGKTIAFIGNYDGNEDLYTLPTAGGVPQRVTHHPARETLCDWSPSGELIFFASYAGLARSPQLYTVPPTGGMPTQLPVPYGYFGAISPDGEWLAYTPYTRDFATWKRYVGGMATDIWLFNLNDNTSRRITDWHGTDSQPMWHGDKLYYLSDAGENHRLNIWMWDPATDAHEQLTHYKEFDVKWPAMGPGPAGGGEIVYQNGTDLYLLDLTTGQSSAVEVTIPGDRPTIRPQRVEMAKDLMGAGVSATGKRVVISARGDIWSVPAKKGFARNLTATSGAAERDPAWSPDGRWVAYLSDATGEYELYITQSDGKGETRQLTNDESGIPQIFRYNPVWSPDSEHIVFTDASGAIYMYTLEGEQLRTIDTDPEARSPRVSWSHDSSWLAYTKSCDNELPAVWLYDVENDAKHQVMSGMFADSWPTFDRKGKYLALASNRNFEHPTFDDIGWSMVYTDTDTLMIVPLRTDVPSPWLVETDEETWDEDDPGDEEEPPGNEDGDHDGDRLHGPPPSGPPPGGPGGPPPGGPEKPAADDDQADEDKPGKVAEDKSEEEEKEPLKIDLEGFESRALRLPVEPGAFYNLAWTNDNKLLYASRVHGDKPAIKLFDLNDEDHEEKTVIDGVGRFDITANGKKLLVMRGRQLAIIQAAPNQKFKDAVPLGDLSAVIDPRAEWRQLFNEAWRLHRDFFYVDNMHGVDWEKMREHYGAMLDDCITRADVGFVISELISELNIGHAYYFGDDTPDGPRVPCGLLGCDYELHDGAYRFSRILHGGAWDADAHSPLDQPGVYVREGDYLLAVNGLPIDTSMDPWAAFQDLGPGQIVTLTVSDQPILLSPEELEAQAEAEKKEKEAKEQAEKEQNELKEQTPNGQEEVEEQSAAEKDEPKTEAEDGDADEEEEAEEEKDPYAGQRDVTVELIRSDGELRYRAWVEHNRARVEQLSDGEVGYIHVPDTGTNGHNELFRQFHGQRDKAALIIDERWNGGGQLPSRMIELLNRPVTNFWAQRYGREEKTPADAHHGPKCMLINGSAGSGGDMFPYLFRYAGLGPLIGMRTWGGLVGIGGTPQLIDGTFVSVPRTGFYEVNGTWGIEGHGVDPDLEVVDDPALMVDGSDPQLDKAVEVMLQEIQRHRFVPTPRPADPDRSGMGVTEADK